MTTQATTADAYALLHRGSLALAQVEASGIRIDTAYLERTTNKITRRIKRLQDKIRESEEFKIWRREYGEKTNLGSRQQLAHVLFDKLKLPYKDDFTGTGLYKTDEHVLTGVDLPFVRDYLNIEKLKKAKGTYLEGIKREVVDGYIHPSFNLHTVVTYRSSVSDPNSQNWPVRNEEIGDLIRRCFIPRKGRIFLEIDYNSQEVRVMACYSKDPTLIAYIEDPGKDMHRDMAMQIYQLQQEQVSKKTRYVAKNCYVFPEFYGSYYIDCAKHLWEAIPRQGLKIEGTENSLKEHLAIKGIKKLGACNSQSPPTPNTFEYHIKKVEEDFWGRRFKVHANWRNEWYENYRSTGYFEMLTGFRCQGLYKKNEAVNSPVQGAAFHCLLWSLIELQQWLSDNRMRTKIVNQMHDAALLDVPEAEIEDVYENTRRIMTKKIRKAWPWIIVPLKTEAEIGRENWAVKEKYSLPA